MNILNKDLIINKLQNSKNEISNFGVKKLGIYGSYVRNEQHQNSDLDILVEFMPGKKNYDNFYDLVEFLESIISIKVDLVTNESISKYFISDILTEVEYIEIAA